METEKRTIIFTLIHAKKEYQIFTFKNEYCSLMSLISDYLGVLGFGLCSGMGSCGTCMVEIEELHSPIRNFALACEVQITDGLANTKITISTNKY